MIIRFSTSIQIYQFPYDRFIVVPPSKPEMNFPTKVNDLSGGKRNKRSATITPKNDTREQDFIERDNIYM